MSNTDYTLPRGKLYFDQFTAGTTNKTGERYFGHCPEINISTSLEKLDHYNSDTAENARDKSVILKDDRTIKFTCDSVDENNVALFFLGASSTLTQTSSTVTDESLTTSCSLDRYYQMGANSGNPSGIRGATAISVKSGTLGAEAARTLNTDYTVDADTGRVYIVPGGAILAGHSVLVTYTRTANTRIQIVSGGTLIEGALRYIADNKSGTNRDIYLPYASIQADGDFSLKGDEWQKVGFTGEILKLGSFAKVYIDGRAS